MTSDKIYTLGILRTIKLSPQNCQDIFGLGIFKYSELKKWEKVQFREGGQSQIAKRGRDMVAQNLKII